MLLSIRFTYEKNCFVSVPFRPFSSVIQISDSKSTYYLGWSGRISEKEVELSYSLASKLNLTEDSLVQVKEVEELPVSRVEVEPEDEDSWEIISANAGYLEEHLLSQVNVVFKDMVFPVWVRNNQVTVRVKNLKQDWAVLKNQSEVIVKPKERQKKPTKKLFRGVPGGVKVVCNEYNEGAVVVCRKHNKFVVGLVKNEALKENHIKSDLVGDFEMYEVTQLLTFQRNTKCWINKNTLEVRKAEFEIEVTADASEFNEYLLLNDLIVFDGFQSQEPYIQVSIKNQVVSKDDWVGFVYLTSESLPNMTFLEPKPTCLLKQFNSWENTLHKITKSNSSAVLYGPSGSGKSSLVSLLEKPLAQELVATQVVSCRDLNKKDMQHLESIQEAVRSAQRKQPCLLVLDDLESICADEETLEQGVDAKLVHCRTSVYLLDLLDKLKSQEVRVLATCGDFQLLNKLLLTSSHFKKKLEVPSLSLEDSSEVLLSYFPDASISSEVSNKLKSFQVSDLFCFAKNTLIKLGTNSQSLLEELNNFIPESLEQNSTQQKGPSWEEIAGMFQTKAHIEKNLYLPIKFQTLYQNYPLKQRSGLLLYGPPGCGKTYIATAIPQLCNMNFISIKGPELLNKYIGASEQAVRDVFQKAKRAAPSILFFDEFEAIAPKRGTSNTGVSDRVVNQFLCELDGVESRENVYVVAATASPDMIDTALLRPGRLDFHIYCPFPDFEERKAIFEEILGRLGFNLDASEASGFTEGFTAADIQGVINDLQIQLAHKDIEWIAPPVLAKTVQNHSPSFSQKQIQAYEAKYSNFKTGKVENVGQKLSLM